MDSCEILEFVKGGKCFILVKDSFEGGDGRSFYLGDFAVAVRVHALLDQALFECFVGEGDGLIRVGSGGSPFCIYIVFQRIAGAVLEGDGDLGPTALVGGDVPLLIDGQDSGILAFINHFFTQVVGNGVYGEPGLVCIIYLTVRVIEDDEGYDILLVRQRGIDRPDGKAVIPAITCDGRTHGHGRGFAVDKRDLTGSVSIHQIIRRRHG